MKSWIIVMILAGCAWAQNTPTIGVLPDNGPSLPATCIIGQIYFRTATTIGLNQCNPANVWTALVAGSGGLPAHLSYADPTLTVSAATFGNGQVCLSGNTSGTACITAPAVAGTTTNPISSANAWGIAIRGAAGTPALTLGGDTTSGVYSPAANYVCFTQQSTQVFCSGPAGVEVTAASGLKLEQNATSTLTSTATAGAVSFDTSTAGNGLGFQTNCRTTVNVTPVTVNANVTTDQSLMAFTLPANCVNLVGRTLRVFVAGVYSTAAASTAQMTLKVKICSVSGCGSGNVASVISIQTTALGSVTVANNAWNGIFYITTQTASTAGAWEPHGTFNIDLGAITAADSLFNDTNTATVTGSPSAIDTTAQNFLQITFAFSAASTSNSVTERQLVIDSVN